MTPIMTSTAASFPTRRGASFRVALLAMFLLLPASCSKGEEQNQALDTHKSKNGETQLASVYGSYLAGIHADSQRDLKSAVRFYGRALAQDPENRPLLRTTFLLSVATGRMDRAIPLAQRVIRLDSGGSVAHLVLALRDVRAGKYDAAERRMSGLPNARMGNIIRPMLVAWTRMGQKNTAGALKALEQLKAQRGFGAFYKLHLAMIQEMSGNRDAAERAYLDLLGQSKRPPVRLIQAVAGFYLRENRADDAKTIVARYASNSPSSELLRALSRQVAKTGKVAALATTAADGIAEALFDVASAFFRERVQRFALVYARLALMARPDLPMARMLIGEILERQKRFEDAKAMYAGIKPGTIYYWPARTRMASVLNALGKTDDSIATLEEIAGKQLDDPNPLIDMGDILRAKERFKESVAAYDRAFARIPKIEKRHWALLYSRGIALERSKDWPRAEADFLKALELQPDQPYVLNYLGYTWVERGRNLKQAQSMIEKAVAQRPRDGYIVDSLGWVLYRLKKYKAAVRNLERAVELRPQDPVINDHLGDAYWRVGRANEARFQWSRALSLKPDKDLIPTIETKLLRGLEAGLEVEKKKKKKSN